MVTFCGLEGTRKDVVSAYFKVLCQHWSAEYKEANIVRFIEPWTSQIQTRATFSVKYCTKWDVKFLLSFQGCPATVEEGIGSTSRKKMMLNWVNLLRF